jgi:hypothetical protein
MPQAAVATGCVDFVLPPEDARPDDEKPFGPILAVLHGATGIDFSLYGEKMVQRHIVRRLALSNIRSVGEYGIRDEAGERSGGTGGAAA